MKVIEKQGTLCTKTSQWGTVFFSCVPPDPNQCHRNEFTCAHGPSAPKASAKMIQSRIFCKFDVDWGLGDEDHHESSSKNGQSFTAGFLYKMTLNGVWGQAHPKTYTRAQNSETLMSATFDVVKNVKGKCENDSVEVCSRKLIAVPL